jgi:flavin reductase (DIM6/NTAB) family NADH-FMN oxidoreductase RutF
MDKVPVALGQAYRLLNPGAVVLVSVGDGARDNLFAVTWNMPLDKDPGMIALLSGTDHHSWPILERTGEFGVSVPDVSLVDAVFGCGTTSGRTGLDKWARFGLTRQAPEVTRVPLVAEAVATLECRVEQIVPREGAGLVIARIVAAQASPLHFPGGAWSFEQGLQLIHHLGGDRFAVSTQVVKARTRP